LLGAWRLVSWYEVKADGEKVYPLGREAQGQIMYSDDGHVSAQLVRKDLAPFGSPDWREATEGERAAAWLDYFGYFGTFSIDEARQAVVHHVEGSWFPNLVGSEQVRLFRLDGDELILDAATDWGQVVIIWRRAGSDREAGERRESA
jgi:hypothetical protein